ncbi:MAG: glycerophosphodiester phosphodiesterase [Flavobacteriales bacterium]
MRYLFIIAACVLLFGCRKEVEAPVPDTTWDLFESSGAVPVGTHAQSRMEGVYTVTEGQTFFGPEAVLSWTWTRTGMDTTYQVSIFCEKDIAYLTGAGKRLDSTLLLNMYWRTLVNTGTGLGRLTIKPGEGVQQLQGEGPIAAGEVRISGLFGMDGDVPDRPFTLVYARPLPAADGFQVIAHRCGGRTADLLPASENSVEMIRMASRLGATGVEMDVRLTSDGIPVLYHDDALNVRCIKPCGLFGPIEDYSYAQLSGIVRLIHGERIPTLREALSTVVHETPLAYVWIDTKYVGSMQVVRDIQQEYMDQAAAEGRDVHLLIGIPGEDQLSNFVALPDHASAPSLCELGVDEVHQANSEVYAPRWTLGLQADASAQMHAEGRRIFTWTLDVPIRVREYVEARTFDGILSNYPSLVAYNHDVLQ